MHRPFTRRIIFTSLLLIILTTTSHSGMAAAAEKKTFLADRHQAKGMTCASCHKESPPQAKVPVVVCTACHGSYTKLAEQTKKVEPNPHASHLGDLACDTCHHGHKASVDHCSSCHTFGMQVP